MFDQLYIHLNNFLNELLCGFRKAHSTQHALFKLLQAWQKELNNSGFIGTILMDLSKAYDCLPHNLLIAKLGAYGLDRSSLRQLNLSHLSKSKWYPNSSKQRTKVGSSYSNWSDIKRGISQDSILGPLLFNIFTNDLFFVIEQSHICNFADDDNNLYSCELNLKTVLENLELMLLASKLLY